MNRRLATSLRGFVDCTDASAPAKLFRALALPASFVYSLVIRARNLLYDLGVCPQTHVGRATVAVGNVTLGGVGKTPFVGWLTRKCLNLGVTPGLVSRGYMAKKQSSLYDARSTSPQSNGALNDEALEQALRFPTTPHFLGSNRVEVAKALLAARPNVDAIILDDAFQHRRIARDLNILLLDALNPFGGGRVVPAGFLREPLSGIKRADAVILSRADLVPDAERETIRKKVAKIAPKAVWAEIAQRPIDVFEYERPDEKDSSPKRTDYLSWRNAFATRRFVAFCGLGAPAGFRKTLARENLDVRSFLPFPDHCAYSEDDYRRILDEAARVNSDAFVVTLKDFVKLRDFISQSPAPVFALGVGIEFLTGQEQFEVLISAAIKARSYN